MNMATRTDERTPAEPRARDPYMSARPLLDDAVAELTHDQLHARLTGPRDRICRLYPVREDAFCTPAYVEDVLKHRFTLNGETHALGQEIDWLHNPSSDVEWHIMLHKFYFAVGLAEHFRATGDRRCLRAFEQLCTSWMQQVPVGFIAADVTARRIQNWLYALRLISAAPHPERPSPRFMAAFLGSIVAQVEHVRANLAPARNHRTLALYAVFVAGVALPELRAAAGWRDKASRDLAINLATDFLPDGVHVELSTDYHHLALRSFALWLRHLRANDLAEPPGVLPRLRAAFAFALHVQRPDGVIPALSDGDASDHRALLALGSTLLQRPELEWAASLGTSGTPPEQAAIVFRDAGYAVLRSGWGGMRHANALTDARADGLGPARDSTGRNSAYADETFIVADAGPLGAGNHGHLDALSFEYYAAGVAHIVDPGRGTYDEGGEVNWRVHFRRTSAHNTVTVDNLDQAAYEHSPRHGKYRVRLPHADARLRSFDAARAPLQVREASLRTPAHETIDQLHGHVRSACYDARHDRRWLRVGRDYLLLIDDLRAPSAHDYRLHLHLDASAHGRTSLTHTDDGCVLDAGQLRVRVRQAGSTTASTTTPTHAAELRADHVAPRYGERLPAPHLVMRIRATNLSLATLLSTAPERELQPRLRPASTRDWHDVAGVGRRAPHASCEFAPQLWRVDLPGRGADVYDLIGMMPIDAAIDGLHRARAWQIDRLRIASRWFVARVHRGRVCALWLPEDAERLT